MSSAVTLGGNGSSLSSSTVYAIATAQSKIRIDSTALNQLSLTTSSSSKQKITIPKFLTLQETRAFLTVLLNKLLFGNFSPEHVQCILESLNCDQNDFGEKFDVTDHYEHFVLLGVSLVLDYQIMVNYLVISFLYVWFLSYNFCQWFNEIMLKMFVIFFLKSDFILSENKMLNIDKKNIEPVTPQMLHLNKLYPKMTI